MRIIISWGIFYEIQCIVLVNFSSETVLKYFFTRIDFRFMKKACIHKGIFNILLEKFFPQKLTKLANHCSLQNKNTTTSSSLLYKLCYSKSRNLLSEKAPNFMAINRLREAEHILIILRQFRGNKILHKRLYDIFLVYFTRNYR